MWFDRLTGGKSRGSRGRDSASRRRPMFVVNARLKDRKTTWGPQFGKVLIVLLGIGIALFLAGLAVSGVTRAMFTDNRDYAMTNLVVICRENPSLAYEVVNNENSLKGTNLFRIPIKALRDRLAKTPCIKTVTVSRFLPHTLEIRISERRPVARLGHPRDESRRLVVDDDGVVFARNRSLPLITGYSAAKIIPGDRIKPQIKDALTLLSFCAASPVGQKLKISAIEIKQEYLEVKLDDGPMVLLEWDRQVPDVKVQGRELEVRLKTLITTIWRAGQAGVVLQKVDLAGNDPTRCFTTPPWSTGGE